MREFVQKLEMPEESKHVDGHDAGTYIGNATAQALDIVAKIKASNKSTVESGWVVNL